MIFVSLLLGLLVLAGGAGSTWRTEYPAWASLCSVLYYFGKGKTYRMLGAEVR